MTARSKYPIYKLLEQRSEFFCPAKWTELYLYLNHGNSNSCHHPIPHKIPPALLSNPSVLHNTPHKLKMQQLMLDGHRPDECHMCWHIEDADPLAVSDRIHKSEIWKDEIAVLHIDPNYVPKFIEVIFDNTCNLMCSYCDSGSSSTWANKIQDQKLLLKTDYRNLYRKLSIDSSIDYTQYVDAWMAWWPEIKDTILTLKLSGGEPLLSKNCWKFIDQIGTSKQLSLMINSNFSFSQSVLEKLIPRADDFKEIIISASIDATGDIAEYARQGLDYNRFVQNIHYWCVHSPSNCKISLQSTVNVFNIWGITDMLDLSIQLTQQYPDKLSNLYNTIVRFPEFQSISVLPKSLRINLANKITDWLSNNKQFLSDKENTYIEKLIIYLTSDPEPLYNLSMKNLISDLLKFITYYDKTAIKQFKDVYPLEFVEWIEECKINQQ